MFIEEVHDLSCMTEILIEAFKTEIYEEVINKKNFNDELLLIAKDKNEIVGFIMFTNAGIDRKTQTIPIISLTYVYVKKNFRNLGIGDQLIKKGLEIIRDRDFVLVVALLLSDVILKYGFEKAIEKNITGSFLGSEYALFVKVLKEELLDIGFQGAVKYQHGAIEWYITHELTMPSKTTCITDNKTGYIACHYTDKNVSAYKEYLQLLITYFTKQAKYIEFGIFENEKEEYRNIINLLEDHREVIWPAIPKSAKSMGTQISIRGKINENIKNELEHFMFYNNRFKWFMVSFIKSEFDDRALMHIDHYGESIYFTHLSIEDRVYIENVTRKAKLPISTNLKTIC